MSSLSAMVFGLVNPPTDAEANQTAAWIFMVLFGGGSVAIAGWWTVKAIRMRDAIPVLAMVGGAIAALTEPTFDRAGLIWYPYDSPLIVYRGYDIPQPAYLLAGAVAYIGLGSYLVSRLIHSKGGRVLWPTFWTLAVLEGIGEIVGTNAGVWSYYGPQPFQVVAPDGFPLYLAFVNALFPIVGGWMLFHIVPRLGGWWRAGMVVAVPPIVYGGTWLATLGPTWVALNSDWPAGLRWLTATLAMGLCLLIVRTLVAFLPAEGEGAEPAHGAMTSGHAGNGAAAVGTGISPSGY